MRNFVFLKSYKKSGLTFCITISYGVFFGTLKFSHGKTVIFTRLRWQMYMREQSVSMSKSMYQRGKTLRFSLLKL